MKNKFGAVSFLTVVLAYGACEQRRETTQSIPCDRACLEDFVDQYLDALVAHDSSRLPLAPNALYTENGQALAMNDAMWQVANAVSNKKLYFADVQSGQVGVRTVVEENGHRQIVMTRLKIEDQQIREIEAIVVEVPYGMPSGW